MQVRVVGRDLGIEPQARLREVQPVLLVGLVGEDPVRVLLDPSLEPVSGRDERRAGPRSVGRVRLERGREPEPAPGTQDRDIGSGQVRARLQPEPDGQSGQQVLLRAREARPLPDLLDRIDLLQRGPRTQTNKKALLAELDQVRRTGIATNDEELESALRSIAAPVRSRSGEVVAAVNVAIPWSPAAMSELVSRLGPTVQATANEIAAQVI